MFYLALIIQQLLGSRPWVVFIAERISLKTIYITTLQTCHSSSHMLKSIRERFLEERFSNSKWSNPSQGRSVLACSCCFRIQFPTSFSRHSVGFFCWKYFVINLPKYLSNSSECVWRFWVLILCYATIHHVGPAPSIFCWSRYIYWSIKNILTN